MSINFEKVDDSICQQVACSGSPGYVWATIDPATKQQLNIPANLKLHPVFMPRKYTDWAERFQNFHIRKDDVWVAGSQKSGTVWLLNIVQKLMDGLNLDVPPIKHPNNFFDGPIDLETSDNAEVKRMIEEKATIFEQHEERSSPRSFQTHLPSFLLPNDFWTIKPKLVYIARNPKDVIVSRYHMIRNNPKQFTGTLNDLCELYMEDHSTYGPIIDHVLSYWQIRHLDNVLFITYEELSANPVDGMKSISEFLGFSYNDEQLKQLADHLSFKKMRDNLTNSEERVDFMNKKDPNFSHCRKGKVGGYQDEMSEDMIKRLDKWIDDKLKNSDFKYSDSDH